MNLINIDSGHAKVELAIADRANFYVQAKKPREAAKLIEQKVRNGQMSCKIFEAKENIPLDARNFPLYYTKVAGMWNKPKPGKFDFEVVIYPDNTVVAFCIFKLIRADELNAEKLKELILKRQNFIVSGSSLSMASTIEKEIESQVLRCRIKTVESMASMLTLPLAFLIPNPITAAISFGPLILHIVHEMTTADPDYIIFRTATDGKLTVVYRRISKSFRDACKR